METGRWAARQVERTHGKAADCANEEGLPHQETKDTKPLAVNTVGYEGGRNSQSHTRVCWKVGPEQNEQVTLFAL